MNCHVLILWANWLLPQKGCDCTCVFVVLLFFGAISAYCTADAGEYVDPNRLQMQKHMEVSSVYMCRRRRCGGSELMSTIGIGWSARKHTLVSTFALFCFFCGIIHPAESKQTLKPSVRQGRLSHPVSQTRNRQSCELLPWLHNIADTGLNNNKSSEKN